MSSSNPFPSLQLTRLDNLNSGTGSARGGSQGLNHLNAVHALDNTSKDNVGTVEPIGDNGGDEELGAIASFHMSYQQQQDKGPIELTCRGQRWP